MNRSLNHLAIVNRQVPSRNTLLTFAQAADAAVPPELAANAAEYARQLAAREDAFEAGQAELQRREQIDRWTLGPAVGTGTGGWRTAERASAATQRSAGAAATDAAGLETGGGRLRPVPLPPNPEMGGDGPRNEAWVVGMPARMFRDGGTRLTPELAAELALGATPIVGDAMSVADTLEYGGNALADLWQGRYGDARDNAIGAGLSAIGILPFFPRLGKAFVREVGLVRDADGAARAARSVGARHSRAPSGGGYPQDVEGVAVRRPSEGWPKDLTDLEGRELGAEWVVGNHTPDRSGPDIPLLIEGELDVARNLVPHLNLRATDNELPAGYDGIYFNKLDPADVREVHVRGDLATPEWDDTVSHEFAHVLDLMTGEIRGNDLTGEMREELEDLYSVLNRPAYHPRMFGYPQAEWNSELVAEGIRLYKQNPERLKAVAPEFAALVRARINTHPILSRYIQFNSLLPWIMGTGAFGSGLPTMVDVLGQYGVLDPDEAER